MQITIDTHELNAEQLGYLESIIRVRKEIYQGYERGGEASKPSEPIEQVTERPPYQAEPPFEGTVIDTSLNEKPKRTRRTKAEIEAENAQNTQEVSEPTHDEENSVEVPQNDSDSTFQYTLSDVKAKAQDLVQKVSRDAVKNTINKYADKISEVKESDYSALMDDFKELEG